MRSKSKEESAPPPPRMPVIGDEIDAKCRKCRAVTRHVVRRKVGWKPTSVSCRACGSTHDFRPPGRPTVDDLSPVGNAAEGNPAEQWRAQMGDRTTAGTPYDPARRFDVGDFIQHPGFGDGVVVACPGGAICEVAFERGTIRLIMAKQPSTAFLPKGRAES